MKKSQYISNNKSGGNMEFRTKQTPHIQIYLRTAYNILKNWDIDLEKDLKLNACCKVSRIKIESLRIISYHY